MNRVRPQPEPPKLRVALSQLEDELAHQLKEGAELLELQPSSPEQLQEANRRLKAWTEYTYELLQQRITDIKVAEEFYGYSVGEPSRNATLEQQVRAFRFDLEHRTQKLESISSRVRLMPQLRNDAAPQEPPPDPRKVFVVYGRNHRARSALFEFLRAIDLRPVEWTEAVASTRQGSPYIGDVLEVLFRDAQAVVVMMTPDDLANLHPALTSAGDPEFEKTPTGQARPNVLFEAGMAMGLNSDRTILVQVGELRPFSDISGRHVVRLGDTLSSRQDLATRLRSAGCAVQVDGTDWHTAGDFAAALEAVREAPAGAAIDLGLNIGPEQIARIAQFAIVDDEFKTATNHGIEVWPDHANMRGGWRTAHELWLNIAVTVRNPHWIDEVVILNWEGEAVIYTEKLPLPSRIERRAVHPRSAHSLQWEIVWPVSEQTKRNLALSDVTPSSIQVVTSVTLNCRAVDGKEFEIKQQVNAATFVIGAKDSNLAL